MTTTHRPDTVAIIAVAYDEGRPTTYRHIRLSMPPGHRDMKFGTGHPHADYWAAVDHAAAVTDAIYNSSTVDTFIRDGGAIDTDPVSHP